MVGQRKSSEWGKSEVEWAAVRVGGEFRLSEILKGRSSRDLNGRWRRGRRPALQVEWVRPASAGGGAFEYCVEWMQPFVGRFRRIIWMRRTLWVRGGLDIR